MSRSIWAVLCLLLCSASAFAQSVTLTDPIDGSSYAAPADIEVAAEATGGTGISIQSVQLYQDGVKIAQSPGDTFVYTVEGLPAGTYRFHVTASTSTGTATSESATVTVTSGGTNPPPVDPPVDPPPPPQVSLTRRYVYDANQLLCKVVEPETGATVYAYDGAGNLVWSASGLALSDPKSCNRPEAEASGRVVRRAYDSRNRTTNLTFPDGLGDQHWAYTPDGLPARVTTVNGPDASRDTVTNTYQYNKRRLLTYESLEGAGEIGEIRYGYSGYGDLSQLTYPSGLVVDYAPNALGQPIRVGSYASGVIYHANGAIAGFTYGNGVTHSLTQNARQLPARSTDSGGALDHAYTYDANGNVTTIDDLARGSAYHRAMQYDGLDRLTQASSPRFGGDGTWHYRYDGVDNLRSAVLNGVQDHAYWYDATNRLTNVKNAAGATVIGLGYDTQGNLTQKNAQQFRFDYGNRLRDSGVSAFALDTRYHYDAHGRRTWMGPKSSMGFDGVASQYSQSGQLLTRTDARNGFPSTNDYIYLGDSLVATIEPDPSSPYGTDLVKYQHTDALGSPVAATSDGTTKGSSGCGVVDLNGQCIGGGGGTASVIERTDYQPYGAPIGKTVDGAGYTGHVMDGGTGLVNMQQRYYDPTIGRFLSVDPVTADGNTGGNFNRYWYTNNNPYGFTDPDGRAPNQAGTTDPSHVYFALRGGSSLQALSDSHGSNANRYFYTGKYGWVDIRHFARAAALVQSGTNPEVVRALGAGNEAVQWATEWGDDYRSGFSPEDLSSNAAGIDFGQGLGDGADVAAAFMKWAKLNRALTDSNSSAGRKDLPATDPSSKGGAGRGSDSNSTPDEKQQAIDTHEVKVYNDCGKICSMELSREARSK